jgi:hypothetical protein
MKMVCIGGCGGLWSVGVRYHGKLVCVIRSAVKASIAKRRGAYGLTSVLRDTSNVRTRASEQLYNERNENFFLLKK